MNSEYYLYGWDIVVYYYRYLFTLIDGLSWQIRTSYIIIILSIVALTILFTLFCLRIRNRNRMTEKYKKVEERYSEPFYKILENLNPISMAEMEEICGTSRTEFGKINPLFLEKVIIRQRFTLQYITYLPNIQTLCKLTGVLEHIEWNLQNMRREFDSLQAVTIMQLPINEGILANYVNHREPDVRNLARIGYMLATDMEPYIYLLDFTNDTSHEGVWSSWFPMALHHIFGWINARERRMPNFLTYVDRAKSEDAGSFFILETAYWGTEAEREELGRFFSHKVLAYRSAALKAASMLRDESLEDEMIAEYYKQPEHIRQETLTAIYSIRSGRHSEFFAEVYRTSPSKQTKELALTYLYDYNSKSRNIFEILRYEDSFHNRLIFDQIDSLSLLKQLRNL